MPTDLQEGQARALAALTAATEAIVAVPAADDPRLYDVYLQRARAHWDLDHDANDVRSDLEMAARCARSQGGSRLLKLEATRLRTRRLDPLHLALCTPEPPFVESMAATFGLPLLAYYARTATNDVITEVRAMSSAFRTGAVDGPADTTGLAAASYAGALGLLASGDSHGARALLKKLERQLDDAPDSAAPPAAGKRLLHGCAVIAAIAARAPESVQGSLAHLAAIPTEPLDLMLLGLVGAATLETIPLDVSSLGLSPATAALAASVQRAWFAVD